jgi:hypothetical protein
MKVEAEAREFHLAHTGSKGSSTHSLQPKHPQPWHMRIIVNILNNIIYQKKKKLQKIVEGNLYEQGEDEIVDVYRQQL